MSIYQKINQVMQAVRGVDKASKNKGAGGYRYAGHEAVTEALRDQFARLGIVRSATQLELSVLPDATVMMKVEVRYTDVEDATSVCFHSYALQPSQTSNKTLTAQQVGQALSYAVKNVEFKLFALIGDPEPDSDDTATDRGGEQAAPSSSASARAKQLLGMFAEASTAAGVEDVRALFKAEWRDLEDVPNIVEAIVAARTSALQRIKGAS